MGGHHAHFLFDTFQGFSLKSVFLFPVLTVCEPYLTVFLDKPFNIGPSWPDVLWERPRCRSPPPSVSICQPPKIETEET